MLAKGKKKQYKDLRGCIHKLYRSLFVSAALFNKVNDYLLPESLHISINMAQQL